MSAVHKEKRVCNLCEHAGVSKNVLCECVKLVGYVLCASGSVQSSVDFVDLSKFL